MAVTKDASYAKDQAMVWMDLRNMLKVTTLHQGKLEVPLRISGVNLTLTLTSAHSSSRVIRSVLFNLVSEGSTLNFVLFTAVLSRQLPPIRLDSHLKRCSDEQ